MFEQDQEEHLVEEPEESENTAEDSGNASPDATVEIEVETEIPAEIDDSPVFEIPTEIEDEPVDVELDEEDAAEVELQAEIDQQDSSEEQATDEISLSDAYAEIDDKNWYVVHCYSGYENKVHHNLMQRIESMGMQDKIFDVVVPTEEEIEVKEGKRRTVERRVFPGYILVNMLLSEESWYVVRNTPGVTGFVGMGNTPIPLRPEEVAHIVKRMEADAPRIKVTFRLDERVRIIEGPFKDFHGTVSELDMERAKVRVMVNFFGRETPVELDFLQVEKM